MLQYLIGVMAPFALSLLERRADVHPLGIKKWRPFLISLFKLLPLDKRSEMVFPLSPLSIDALFPHAVENKPFSCST